MSGNLKALGLALVAVFAMGAVGAAGASATDLFTSPLNTTVVTGSGTVGLTITSPKTEINCATNKFSGTFTGKTTTSITVFPTWFGTKAEPNNEKCETSLGNTKIDINGCDLVLTGETTGADKDVVGKDATVSLVCPTGKEIQTTAPLGCTISIPSQTPTEGGVTYTNGQEATGIKDITIKLTMTGLTFTSTSACQLVGIPKEANNFDLTGSVTMTGFEDQGNGTATDEFKDVGTNHLEVSGS